MIQLVKSKKYQKKKRYHKKMRRYTMSFSGVRKHIRENLGQFLWPLVILLLLVSGVTMVFQLTFFDKTNYISRFQYAQDAIDSYDNPYLYQTIEDLLTGKNIYSVNFWERIPIRNMLQEQFPMIADISFSKLSAHTAGVRLVYRPPSLLFHLPLQERVFGVW